MIGKKINEIEALVGITKKNIRFYEAQGLLSPKRNAENSYRDYSEQEVQSKNIGRDFMAGMKTLVGGELKGYTEMLIEARQIATKRMVDEAEAMGADAIVNIRFGSSAVMQGAAEVIAYGTAVKFL